MPNSAPIIELDHEGTIDADGLAVLAALLVDLSDEAEQETRS